MCAAPGRAQARARPGRGEVARVRARPLGVTLGFRGRGGRQDNEGPRGNFKIKRNASQADQPENNFLLIFEVCVLSALRFNSAC